MSSTPSIDTYLDRIRYSGPREPDASTLSAIQHQHLLHIPYENIDVRNRTPLDFDIERIFDKLVLNNRGGWCYEMNGLLGWALGELGFQVTRMCGAVNREHGGEENWGNHLVLRVDLDVPHVVDVGVGDGLRFPVPIAEAEHTQGGLAFRLQHLEDDVWRVHNHPFSNVTSFDFRNVSASQESEDTLWNKCSDLQSDPQSHFRLLLIVQKFNHDSIDVLIGRILTRITPSGKTGHTLANLDQMQTTLEQTFGLREDIAHLWDDIQAKHEWMLEQQAKQGTGNA